MKTNTKVDFFLVGAARCGTTSLYNHLSSNQEIFLPNVKEPNFFSDVSSPKAEDYETPDFNNKYHAKIITSKAVYDSLYKEAQNEQIKGDTSPSYLWDKTVAKKIYDYNPKAQIIISLRHPVDRAYSHYIMNYFTGVDTFKTFKEALDAPDNLVWGSCNQYLEMSMYYEQLKAYYDTFPKEQIKVIVYEDWTKDIETNINDLFKFLGVNNSNNQISSKVQHNKIKPIKNIGFLNFLRKNGIKRFIKKIINQDQVDRLKSRFFENNNEIKKLDIETRTLLSSQFKEDIKNLSQLTNINFAKKWDINH